MSIWNGRPEAKLQMKRELAALIREFCDEYYQWQHVKGMEKPEATLADFASWLEES